MRFCVKFRIFISFPCDLLDKSMKFPYTEDEGARNIFICTLPHPHWNRVRIWMRFFLFSPSFCRITVFGNLIFCSIDISPARGYTCKYKRKNERSIIVRYILSCPCRLEHNMFSPISYRTDLQKRDIEGGRKSCPDRL